MTKVKKISEAFKGGPNNCPPRFFLSFGPDPGFVSAAVNSLANELSTKVEGIETRRIYDSDIANDFLGFENSVSNTSLFGGAILAIVRLQNESLSAKIIEFLERIESGKIHILGACYFECGDLTAKSKLVQAFEASKIAAALRLFAPSKAEFMNLVKERALTEGVTIDSQVIELILESAAQDSLSICAQVESLALYVGKGGKIDEDAFNALNYNLREAGIDEVLSAAFNGETKLTLVRAHQCLNGDSNAILLLNQLLRRVKMLLSLQQMVESGKSINEVVEDKRNGVFWKEQPAIARQLSIWPRAALESILAKAIYTDIECKKRGALVDALVEGTLLGISEFAANKRQGYTQ